MEVKTSAKKVKLTGNKYKSVTQMVNKLASPKFKKEWLKLQNVREIKGWALIPKEYNPDGKIMEVKLREPKNPITYEFNEVIRVSIKEIK